MNELQVTYISPDDLVPYINNAKVHHAEQIDAIAGSIKEFGFNNPILIDGENGVIAGHGRLQAAKKLKLEQVPTIDLSHMTDAQRRAYVLADNRLGEIHTDWDMELVQSELAALEAEGFDVDLTGFDESFLPEEETEGLTDEDEVPEPPEEPATVLGDIWLMGGHRLMCGDSSSFDSVERLMDGRKADMVFTDPPYNVAYEGKTKDALTIKNDSMSSDDFYQLLEDVFINTFAQMSDGAPIYVTCPLEDGIFQRAFMSAGFRLQSILIWLKNTMVMGRKDYHYKHEPILYGWKEGAAHFWQGGRDKTTIISCDKPPRNGEHPTMKPVELIEILLGNSGRHDAVVADFFGGSGSTLMACENTGRYSMLMELDPKYCDVIVRRWEEYTGKQATLEGDGRTFAEIKAERLNGST